MRRLAGAAALALVAAALSVGAPASATVFDPDATDLQQNVLVSSTPQPDCTGTGIVTSQKVPVPEDAGPRSLTQATHATFGSTHAGDHGTGDFTTTTTASVTTAGGLPHSVDFDAEGDGRLDIAANALGCRYGVGAGAAMEFAFTLTAPVYVDIDTTLSDHAYAEVDLHTDDYTGSTGDDGIDFRYSGTTHARLPAGSYEGLVRGVGDLYGTGSTTTHASVRVHLGFTTVGSQLVAPSGKATKYVALPAAASCTAGALQPTVTGKGKRAAQVRKVTFSVNGHVALTDRKAKKGEVETVPVTGTDPLALVADVQLRSGKHLTAAATYQAC